jgi:hypothetical protein
VPISPANPSAGLQHERVRRGVGPHDHKRHVDRARADFRPVQLVREPLRVQAQAPRGGAKKGVWLGEAEGEKSADQRHPESGHTIEELPQVGSPTARPDEGQAEHRQQHERADLARGCQASQHARHQRIRQALALPGPLAKEK